MSACRVAYNNLPGVISGHLQRSQQPFQTARNDAERPLPWSGRSEALLDSLCGHVPISIRRAAQPHDGSITAHDCCHSQRSAHVKLNRQIKGRSRGPGRQSKPPMPSGVISQKRKSTSLLFSGSSGVSCRWRMTHGPSSALVLLTLESRASHPFHCRAQPSGPRVSSPVRKP